MHPHSRRKRKRHATTNTKKSRRRLRRARARGSDQYGFLAALAALLPAAKLEQACAPRRTNRAIRKGVMPRIRTSSDSSLGSLLHRFPASRGASSEPSSSA